MVLEFIYYICLYNTHGKFRFCPTFQFSCIVLFAAVQ